MGEDLIDYKNDLLEEIHQQALINGETYDQYFLESSLDKLTSMGDITDPQITQVYKKGKNGRIMSFDAYAFDEYDKSVVLISSDFVDNTTDVLIRTDIDKIIARMLNFLEEANNDKLDIYFDMTDDILRVGKDIGRKLRIDYVDIENDCSIDKIKLFILTNKNLSDRITSLKHDNFLGKKVEVNVWSVERFYDVYKSGNDREPIKIDVNKYGLNGIPCIKAQMEGNLDYDAYLAIVPGKFLNDIYYDHGSRLLEGNVRAFLSNRGKINKGIRETIRKEPTKFFAYNNGIACTAKSIHLSKDGHSIVEMEDLQIINGGQTTASLNSAFLRDKMTLDNIFVPMKLTVVKDDDYETMIQNISKYANSQNKVTDADLFSNHPFHRAFEALSKKYPAPAKEGGIATTMWYYERSRGKYEQEQFKFLKKSEKEAFVKKYPKNQVIKKEELAKFYNAAKILRPDIVSKGSQKSMKSFAEYIDEKYQTHPEIFNEMFYKICICYAILYKKTDAIVASAPWYNVGGYKLNIVPYTVSKLIYSLPDGYTLDYDRIWRKQELYPSLVHEIEKMAEITNDFVIDSKGVIVTEYCKKEDTWNKYKAIKYSFSKEFINDLMSKNLLLSKFDSSKKEAKTVASLNIETEIYKLGGSYWRRLIEEGKKRNLLSQYDIDLLSIAASIDTARPKIASPKQAKEIWKIRGKLDEHGVLV